MGPGGWGVELAVLFHHQERPDHWTAHHIGWEITRFDDKPWNIKVFLVFHDSLWIWFNSLIIYIGPCVNYSGCQITWAKFCKVLQQMALNCSALLLVIFYCFVWVFFFFLPLHRKTWQAKASPSGCGLTTLLTWWKSTFLHCGMKGERSCFVYSQAFYLPFILENFLTWKRLSFSRKAWTMK